MSSEILYFIYLALRISSVSCILTVPATTTTELIPTGSTQVPSIVYRYDPILRQFIAVNKKEEKWSGKTIDIEQNKVTQSSAIGQSTVDSDEPIETAESRLAWFSTRHHNVNHNYENDNYNYGYGTYATDPNWKQSPTSSSYYGNYYQQQYPYYNNYQQQQQQQQPTYYYPNTGRLDFCFVCFGIG